MTTFIRCKVSVFSGVLKVGLCFAPIVGQGATFNTGAWTISASLPFSHERPTKHGKTPSRSSCCVPPAFLCATILATPALHVTARLFLCRSLAVIFRYSMVLAPTYIRYMDSIVFRFGHCAFGTPGTARLPASIRESRHAPPLGGAMTGRGRVSLRARLALWPHRDSACFLPSFTSHRAINLPANQLSQKSPHATTRLLASPFGCGGSIFDKNLAHTSTGTHS